MRGLAIPTLALLLFTTIGCQQLDPVDLAAAQAEARAMMVVAGDLLAAAKLARDDAAVQLEAMPPGADRDKATEHLAAFDAGLAVAEKHHADWSARVDAIGEIMEGDGGLEGVRKSLPVLTGPLGPYAPIATLAGGLLIGLAEAWRRHKIGVGVIKAVQAARTIDAGASVNFADPTTKAVLDAVMGTSGKKLVDSVQKKEAI
jgi:hypothetical protein